MAYRTYGVTAGEFNGDGNLDLAGPNFPLARDPFDSNAKHRDMFGGAHPGVCLFALADGHVAALSTSIDVVNLGYLANRADGQTITVDH